jgi:hypothetical protein
MPNAKLPVVSLLILVTPLLACDDPRAFPEVTDAPDAATEPALDETSGGIDDADTDGASENDTEGNETGGALPEPDADPDPWDDDGSTGANDPLCPTRCLAEAPEGWSGPTAIREVGGYDLTPSCDDDEYTELSMVAHGGFTAPPAECGCSCSSVSGASCDGEVQVIHFQNTQQYGCTVAAAVYDLTAGTILDIPNLSGTTRWAAGYLEAPHLEGGSCQPIETESIQAAGFARTVSACDAPLDSQGCFPGAVCQAPTPSGADMCIWRPGEHECPAETYTDRSVYHQDFSDSRGCSACSCGNPSGSCEDPYVRLLSTQFFSHHSELEIEPGCQYKTSSDFGGYEISGIQFNAGTPSAQCAPSGGTAYGGATATDPVTVCCVAD